MKQSKDSVVEVKAKSYQPSRPELREKIHIPTTPEQLAKAVVQSVAVKAQK